MAVQWMSLDIFNGGGWWHNPINRIRIINHQVGCCNWFHSTNV